MGLGWLIGWAWPTWRPHVPPLHPLEEGGSAPLPPHSTAANLRVGVEEFGDQGLGSGCPYKDLYTIPWMAELIKVQAEAFFDSPAWAHCFACQVHTASEPERKAYWQLFFRAQEALTLMWACPHREAKVFLGRDGETGAILTTATLGTLSHHPHTKDWLGYMGLAMLESRSLSVIRTNIQMGQSVDKMGEDVIARMELDPKECLYIANVATLNAGQGKGLGSKMFQALIEEVDRQGKVAVLDTEKERNLVWYKKFGFTQEGEVVLKGTLPGQKDETPFWRMVRFPKKLQNPPQN